MSDQGDYRAAAGALPVPARLARVGVNVRTIRRYRTPGAQPKGIITVIRDPDSVFVEAFDTVKVTAGGTFGEYTARCSCFDVQGRGLTRRDAIRDLELRLERSLSRMVTIMGAGEFEKALTQLGFTEEKNDPIEELLKRLLAGADQVVQVEALG